jgi:hypothetical protein
MEKSISANRNINKNGPNLKNCYAGSSRAANAASLFR